MAKVIQIALPGKNVLTATDPDDFALFADQSVDYILIKEKARGYVEVPSSGGGYNISHGLGYVPSCLAFAEISAGVWRKLFASPFTGDGLGFTITTTNLNLSNLSGSPKNFAYYIFYDNIT